MRKPHGAVDGFPIHPKWVALLLAGPLLTLSLLLAGALDPLKPHAPSDFDRSSDHRRLPEPPRLAYLISSTRGDGRRIKRLLQAVYHPWNFYLIHLDHASLPEERADLVTYAASEATFVEFDNVRVVKDDNPVSSKGPTVIACTLHAVAILLREFEDWSWFINLSATDYPLMPQDDILHVFSYLPRDFNFIKHTSDIGWREYERARPIIVDPWFYKASKTDVFWAKEKRSSIAFCFQNICSYFPSGGWCLGNPTLTRDPCFVHERSLVLRPTGNSRRLESLLVKLLDADNFRPRQCI